MPMANISDIISNAAEELTRIESSHLKVREDSENVVRVCGRAMQLIHAGKPSEARHMLNEIKPIIEKFKDSTDSGALIAQQEYVEAILLMHFITGEQFPHYNELGVPPEAYILGLADALGEARREIVEHMRKDDYATATRLFESMSEIYELLLPLRFSNSVLPGFRRKIDVSRSLVEQCRRDLLMFKISKNL